MAPRKSIYYKDYHQKYRERNPDYVERQRTAARLRARKRLPSPTREEPDHCEMCLGLVEDKGMKLCLDHNHNTNEFRGWICRECNIGLGLLGDCVDVAIKNLQRYSQIVSRN